MNVTGGKHVCDHGTVARGPFDLRPSHVWVDLQRAGESLYIPVWELEPRVYEPRQAQVAQSGVGTLAGTRPD